MHPLPLFGSSQAHCRRPESLLEDVVIMSLEVQLTAPNGTKYKQPLGESIVKRYRLS